MIDDTRYETLLDNGLILDHYFLLSNMKNNIKSVNNKRIQGFINLLTKKGYIEDDKLTETGLRLVETCKVENNKMDFGEWVLALHKKLQDKIVELTGKKQVIAKIKNVSYSFLDNPRDISLKLSRAIAGYKLKDLSKIEKTLLAYIEKCHKSDNWFPLMKYYILKDGVSAMVTEMDNEEEEVPQTTSKQKFI